MSSESSTVHMFVCSECGGVNVQTMEWVDANTNKMIGGAEGGGVSNNWCEDCEDNVKFDVIEVSRSDYEDRIRNRKDD